MSLVNTGTAASNLNATAKLGHVDIPLVPRTAEAHPGLTRIPGVLADALWVSTATKQKLTTDESLITKKS